MERGPSATPDAPAETRHSATGGAEHHPISLGFPDYVKDVTKGISLMRRAVSDRAAPSSGTFSAVQRRASNQELVSSVHWDALHPRILRSGR